MNSRWLFVALFLICAGAISLFAFTGYSIRGQLELRKNAERRQCLSANETRRAIADVFLLMQQTVNHNPNQTPEAREKADEFFSRVYARLAPRDCSP